MGADICRDEVGELLKKHRQAKSDAGIPVGQEVEGDMDGLLEDLIEIEAGLRAAPPPEPAATPAPVEQQHSSGPRLHRAPLSSFDSR